MKLQLYRYFGSHAFESLRDKRLMIARPSTLNDPFEFLYISTGQMTMPRARQYIKSRIKSDTFYDEVRKWHPNIRSRKDFKRFMRAGLEDMAKKYFDRYDSITESDSKFFKDFAEKHFRLLCFSAPDVLPREEILMWSHYAAKHTGVRIRFLLDDSVKCPYSLKKVLYSKERPGIDLTCSAETEKFKSALVEVIRTKADGWAYEREYRMFSMSSHCVDETGADGAVRSFMAFDANIVSQIDFGLECPKSEIDRISILARAEYPHAELRKATYHKSKYAIEYVKI